MTANTISGLRWWMIGPLVLDSINDYRTLIALQDASLAMPINSNNTLEKSSLQSQISPL
jgi:hypothetical protein